MPRAEFLLMGMVLKGSLVLAVAWLAARLLRRRSAAVRHLVWVSAFAALLVLPLLTVSLPALPVRVAPGVLPSSLVFQVFAVALPEAPPAPVSAPHVATAAAQPAPWRPDWRWSLVALWAAGAALALAQMLASWIALARTRRTARALPLDDLRPLAGALGLRQPVDILEIPEGSMPMAFGLLRPVVFLPVDAAEWTPQRRRLVLLHELAHIRRGDLATHLLARVACCLYWWNPLAWTAWRHFLKEREHAADDRVLTAGAIASDYAGHLLEIARSLHSAGLRESAALAMARRSQLEGRLLAILDSTVSRQSPGRVTVAAAALLALAVIVPFSAIRAQSPAPQPDVHFRAQTPASPDASLPASALEPQVDATIRAAVAQKNHDMLDQAAKAAQVQRQYDVARSLLDSSLAVRADVAGEQSVDYGTGLLKLGDLERARGRRADAEAFYTKAVSVLGSRPEAFSALLYLALGAMPKDLDQAADDLQQAQVADPSRAAEALTWLAVVRERQQNTSDAESLYKQALAMEAPASGEAANTMVLYSQFLKAQGRAEESEDLRNRAIALRKTVVNSSIQLAQAAGPIAFKVGNGTTAPALLSKVEPQYTDEARAAKYQGTVVVSTEIGTDGHAHNTQVVRALGLGLDEKAMDAISQWTFKPGAKEGQPVPVMATIEVNFRLL